MFDREGRPTRASVHHTSGKLFPSVRAQPTSRGLEMLTWYAELRDDVAVLAPVDVDAPDSQLA